MAKFPSYVKLREVKRINGELRLSLSVRRWHPQFWLILLGAFFKQVASLRWQRD